MHVSDQELKVSRMEKRSQSKNIFTRDCYKLREFVLTPFAIKHYDASGGNRGRERGSILLQNVKFIEKVPDDRVDNKRNVFQFAFIADSNASTANSLHRMFVVAGSLNERDDWISLVRFYAKERNACFLGMYHPGLWIKPGRYSCCDAIIERAYGCCPVSPPGTIAPNSASNGHSMLNYGQQQQLVMDGTNGNTFSSMLTSSAATDRQNAITAINMLQMTAAAAANTKQQQQQQQNQFLAAAAFLKQQQQHQQQQMQEENNNSEKVVIAIHNYNPFQKNQLKLKKGETYFILDQSNEQWWFVRNAIGETGYVPTNYIQKPDSLNSFDWYYKDLTRQQAEAILLEEKREGCFLVRDSVSKKNTYTLSVTSKDADKPQQEFKVHHYLILRTTAEPGDNNSGSKNVGYYYLSKKHTFRTIAELIHYHKHNSGGLIVRLRSPPLKDRESPVTAGLGLDEFEIDPDELKIENEEIGKGQFGVVKLGLFRQSRVAIKQMVEGTMNEEDFIEEAKNMRFLNHPNLVQLFGVVLKKRPIMIITEYMPHGSLREFLPTWSKHQMNERNTAVVLADVCLQLANGMNYLEKQKFVHRDLAARNCLVKVAHYSYIHVKVADFGMARFLLDNVYEPSAGTKFPVRWAPPEVFQSKYTAKADVWSFGVLMWEVFTFCIQVPYYGKTNAQVFQYIISGGRLEKPVICPEKLYRVMISCWSHDPAERPRFASLLQQLGEDTETVD